jgi:two-component system, cell cycle sensor histidine kinase and response regulator CckA
VRFTRFFNNTPIAIAAIDRRGRIVRTNAPFLKLFGFAKGELMAGRRRLIELVQEPDRDKLNEAIEAAISGTGEIPAVDVAIAGKGSRSARFYVNPVEDGVGDEEAAIVNALDITEQRTLAQQFAQSQKMNLAGQLAGGVAHDFNNILTAVIGFSDLLLANHRPSDPSFQDIMNIKQNANRAAGLVRQLLAFSRRQTLRPQVLALNDVLSDLSILLTRLLGENVKLSVNHGRDLWPIKADLNQFETVIINLAVNGRDAMPGGGTMTIRTRNLRAEEVASFAYHPLPTADYVLIEVEDTGTGMTAEVQAKIFEPFFSTKEVGKGTGLGLSTVYGIVKQTGAHIFFSSHLGQGTVFRIFMPRYIPAEGEKPAGPVAENNTDIADLTGTATILLVEDEEAVRAFAARALQSRGYKVYEAATGVEALEVMEEAGGKVDLVVSDVVMPELDGPSLLRELRKTRPELKIIFISGYAEDAFKKNLPEGETFHFLPKPFSLKQLAIAVKETLGR